MGYEKYVKEERKQGTSSQLYDSINASICRVVSKGINDMIKKSEGVLSKSILVAIALDKEISRGKDAFKYPISLPEDAYIPGKYLSEAKRIVDLLKDFEKGITLHGLILCRRQIGIEDKTHMLYAIREVLEKDMAYLCRVKRRWQPKGTKGKLIIRLTQHFTGSKGPDKNYKKITGDETKKINKAIDYENNS